LLRPELIVRPTGLLDPTIEIKPTQHQVDDVIDQIQERISNKQRVLVTTLTKRMAEELATYLTEMGTKAAYIHSDVDTLERLEILREADSILQDEVRRAGLYRELWQSFAVLPAIRSVGVQGDERTYAYPIVIRAVTSEDAMTADWARLPSDLLARISSRIVNEVEGVNRVVYDITSKPPSTIEWE
jgi:hypothetical protein